MTSNHQPVELTLDDVIAARQRINSIATRTPLRPSISLTKDLGVPVALKMETMQATGAFKLRGACNAILSLEPTVRHRGVVTASSGNHGRAVAYVAGRLGIPVEICLSKLVPRSKVEAIRELGAQVNVVGDDQDEAMRRARDIARNREMTFIDPFDDLAVIAGQATIGLEILEDNPDVETIVVPLSGGGLMGGIAFAAKSIKPDVRLVGVTMERGAAMHHSLKAGRPIEVEELPTIADALQGGIGMSNRYSFQLCQTYVDDAMLINEEQIKKAMAYAYWKEHLVLEGAGACGIGLLLAQTAGELGANVVTICSGDNVDPGEFLDIVGQQSR